MRGLPSSPASFPTPDLPPVPPSPSSQSLIPPLLGLVRLRIPGFAKLQPTERMQASVLALNRDFSISAADLKLAVATAPDSSDEALVAYCHLPQPGETTAANPSTQLLAAVKPGVVYWVAAPGGFVVGEHGAATVEQASGDDASLPSVVAATISQASTVTPRCVLVDRDRTTVTDDVVAHWAAASGAEMVDGKLPAGPSVTLVSPPRIRTAQAATRLDRALQWSAVAATTCAVIAGLQFASSAVPAPIQGAVDGKRLQGTAGALFERIATVVPEAASQLQNGTYAGGAWVLTVPDSVDAAALSRMTRSLESNGLAAQSTHAPGPRLRVQLP